jgi:hypothetical protein
MEADRAAASTVLLRSNAKLPPLSLPSRPTLLDLLAAPKMSPEVATHALAALQELVQALPTGEPLQLETPTLIACSLTPALAATHLSSQLSIFSTDEVTRSTIALIRADSAFLRDLVLQRILPPLLAANSAHVQPLASAAAALCCGRLDVTACDVALQLLQVLAEEPCSIPRLAADMSVTQVLEGILQSNDSETLAAAMKHRALIFIQSVRSSFHTLPR